MMFKLRQAIKKFLTEHKSSLSKTDITYIQRSLLNVDNHFSFFYITAKVYKTPRVPHPIVSQYGSILDGNTRWLTKQLKPLSKRMPSFLPSSKCLKNNL